MLVARHLALPRSSRELFIGRIPWWTPHCTKLKNHYLSKKLAFNLRIRFKINNFEVVTQYFSAYGHIVIAKLRLPRVALSHISSLLICGSKVLTTPLPSAFTPINMVRRIDEYFDRTYCVESLLIYAWQTFDEISRERRACASHICRDLGSFSSLCNLLISHAFLVPLVFGSPANLTAFSGPDILSRDMGQMWVLSRGHVRYQSIKVAHSYESIFHYRWLYDHIIALIKLAASTWLSAASR